MNNFQRAGSISNAHVGKEFENTAKKYFESRGLSVKENYPILLGVDKIKKSHNFDLGGINKKGIEYVVECKSHTWTSGKNVPSAKLTVWNEVMLYFSLLSTDTQKILFVLKDCSEKRQETLAEYYIRTYQHLIPKGVQILEYDNNSMEVSTVYNSY